MYNNNLLPLVQVHPRLSLSSLIGCPALAASSQEISFTAENLKRPKPGIARYKPCMWDIRASTLVDPPAGPRLVASSIKVMSLQDHVHCYTTYLLAWPKAKFQCKKKTHASHVALLSESFSHRDDAQLVAESGISEHTCSVGRSVS